MYVQSLFALYVLHGDWNVVAALAAISSLLSSGADHVWTFPGCHRQSHCYCCSENRDFYLTPNHMQHCHCQAISCSKLTVLDLRWLDNQYTIVWVEFFWLSNHSDTFISVTVYMIWYFRWIIKQLTVKTLWSNQDNRSQYWHLKVICFILVSVYT
jgi:hypothetical protein